MNAIDRSLKAAETPAAVAQPLILARQVKKTYVLGEQTVRALDDVSFDVAEGEFVAIMGPSGSGKSTMMNLIGALDVPTSGSLEIGGRDIARLSSDELAELRNRTIGFVFQQFNLLPRTSALKQVMLPLAYAKDMQEDKEGAMDAIHALSLCIAAMAGMVRDLEPDRARMRAAAGDGYSTATDLADWLVREL